MSEATKETVKGKTVTFRGCPDDPGVRSVRVGDQRFLRDVPEPGVDSKTLETLKGLDGHEFDVE